jgi:hypothetical protein
MNLVVHVLHLQCTIGKKEGIYLLGLHGKKAFWNWLENRTKQQCLYLARRLDEQYSILCGSWRIVQRSQGTKLSKQSVLKLIMHEGYAPFMFDSFDLIDIPSSEEEQFPLLVTHVPMITP